MEKVAKFQTKLKTPEAGVVNFGIPAEDISNLIREGISFTDVREKFKRMEEKAQKLLDKKDDLHSLSPGIDDFDVEGLETRIRKGVIDEVKKAEAIVSQFLKDSTPVSTAATAGADRTGGGTGSSNTKKEAMQLPRFSGEEKGGQAFLKYPIWSKNWMSQITDYEENTE